MAEYGGSDQANDAAKPTSSAWLDPASSVAVFISYASQDAAIAAALVENLERTGVGCWIAPRDVRPGDFYADAIVQAINASPVLVLLLSQHSVNSAHVLREVERASAKKRPVITFRIDTETLPPGFEYFLSASQWIDASGGNPERAFPKLAEALRGRTTSTPATEGEPRRAVPPPTKKSLTLFIIFTIIVVVAGLAFLIYKLRYAQLLATQPPTPVAASVLSDKSIAVLPFTDMSEKKDQEYFADGIAEEVLNRLAQVPGLKVVGRASSFKFKGTSADPGSVGAALGVAYLLEGSVRRESGRVRVGAQLLEARTGLQRWSNHFDAEVTDVLQVQDTIATELARAMQLAVEGDTTPRGSIKSPEALEIYLRGLQALDSNSQEGCEAAVADFQKVLAQDSGFAPAAMNLSQAYILIGSEGWLPTSIAFERAREAAKLAETLDPKSQTPHILLATIHMQFDWDWAGAEQELHQAFALGPHETLGTEVASRLSAAQGKWDDAKQLGLEAVELDPLAPDGYVSMGAFVNLPTGHLTEAEQSLRRAIQIAPRSGSVHYFLGVVLMLQGNDEAALAEFKKETVDDGQLEGSAMADFAAGRKSESDARLTEAIRQNATDWPSEIARVYAFRGEKNHAFEWLDRAYEKRDEDLYFIKGDPLLKSLEGDPRYKAFLRKMNLPE